MEISHLRNPYDYANPVRDSSLFAGRNSEIAKLLYVLDQAGVSRPVSYVGLYGQRASGKTSILNMVQTLARARGFLTVRVDLVPGDTTCAAFFAKLYEELVGAAQDIPGCMTADGQPITPRIIRRIAQGSFVDQNFPLEFPESLAHARTGGRLSEMALRADLAYIARAVGRPIVLLIDEAQIIADDEDVLSVLRTLGMQLNGYVFVLAGTPDLLDKINDVFDRVLRQFELIEIGRFREDAEVLNCITQPLEQLGLSAPNCFGNLNSTAFDLQNLTDGNPYEIQLYCHVMFARWQTGVASEMKLAPDVISNVRSLLEAGREVQQHPSIAAIQKMTPDELVALNILCSALQHAEISEIWLAHNIPSEPRFTESQLTEYLSRFVETGIVEMVDGTLRVNGGRFVEIYARLWTASKVDLPKHPQLINRLDFDALLSRNLEYLVCEAKGPAHVLRTCCPKMSPRLLDTGISLLDTLAQDQFHFTIPFLHEAIVECGFPAALDITSVECVFQGRKATRWLYAPDSIDFDVSNSPQFIEAGRRISKLGGSLSADRTRLALKPWASIVDWLAQAATPEARLQMLASHVAASFKAYSEGDKLGTVTHLETAHRLNPRWEPANNLSHILLTDSRPEEALTWSVTAIDLAGSPIERALSKYNKAMALLQIGDFESASAEIVQARSEASSLAVGEYLTSYLLQPRFDNGNVNLHEEQDVDLLAALSTASEVADLAHRYARIQGS